jgi:hypothetical protein
MRTTLSCLAVAAACLLWAPNAHARPDAKGRPFGTGTIIPRVGFGFGYSADLISLGWGIGAGYFVVDGLEIGGVVSGTHLLWSRELKDTYPGIEDRLPGTLMEITPLLRYVFFRSPYFSPYAFAGVGPTFLTNNEPDPVLGHWTAGPGFFIGLGRHVFLDISVSFSGRFPSAACTDAYTDVFTTSEGPVELQIGGYCGFRWSPGIGIGFSF